MKRIKRSVARSQLRPGIRAILRRTAIARAKLDEISAGIMLEGDPITLGEPRMLAIDDVRERYKAQVMKAA